MRYFNGLAALARGFEEVAILERETRHASAALASEILYKKVVGTFGDSSKLADLAPSTQADRTARGYTPNDPLVRTGELLRDSVEHGHEGSVAGVGSAEEIQKYHEYGYINARTGNSVPPRPVFKIAAQESIPEILAIVESSFPAMFGGGSVKLVP